MKKKDFLNGARVYLSGPMDFVASRDEEKKSGWRVRVKQFLESYGATVFDPWEKPMVRGLHEYGKEDLKSIQFRDNWTFEDAAEGAKTREECAQNFWETMHIDLRMVDISDFVISYCPTNIYSVGTPHEIVVARQQHKPVLFVSPPVGFSSVDQLTKHLLENKDDEGMAILEEIMTEVPIKPNPKGTPSLWYMPLIGGNNFFDGFGFSEFQKQFDWPSSPSDKHEKMFSPKRPLLSFLKKLNDTLPQKWNSDNKAFVQDDDWLLLDLES